MRIIIALFIAIVLYISPSLAQRTGTCRGFSCPSGTSCLVVDGYPVCVTNEHHRPTHTPRPTRPPTHSLCNQTHCPSNYECFESNGIVPETVCKPIDNECDYVYCPEGTHCFNTQYNGPVCYPDDEYPQLCRVTRCPRGFTCRMHQGNPTCTQTSNPICPTCSTYLCAPNHRCFDIINPNNINCPTRPICIPIGGSTTSTTGSSTTGTSTTGTSTTGTSTTGTSTTGTSTTGTSTTGTSTTGSSTTGTSTTGTSSTGTSTTGTSTTAPTTSTTGTSTTGTSTTGTTTTTTGSP